MDILNTYPATKGELIYLYDTIKELADNLTIEASEDTDLKELYIESLNIINKILEFKGVDKLIPTDNDIQHNTAEYSYRSEDEES